jgi:hypothetical protein
VKNGVSTYQHLRADGCGRLRAVRLAFGLYWWI